MKVVAIVSQKGGAGKTTVSTELAVMAVQNGYRTVVFRPRSASLGRGLG